MKEPHYRPLTDADELHRSFLVTRGDEPAFEQLFLGKADGDLPRYLAVDVRWADWEADGAVRLALVVFQPAPQPEPPQASPDVPAGKAAPPLPGGTGAG